MTGRYKLLYYGNKGVQLYGSKASEIKAVSEIMGWKSLIDSTADNVVEKLKVTSIDKREITK